MFFPSLAFNFPVDPSIILNKRPLLRYYKSKKAHSQITNAVKDDGIWRVPVSLMYFFPTPAFPVKLIVKGVSESLTAYRLLV